MVGVPRSSGCQLCRKRRVKCDEVKPACGNCLRYGAECPGYEKQLKFVSGKHVVRPKGSGAKLSPSSQRGGSSSSSSSSSGSPSSSSSLMSVSSPAQSITRSPSPNRAQFVATMLASATVTLQQRDVTGFFSWMQLGSIGMTAGLDSALCCLSMHIVGKNIGDAAMVASSRTLYGQSLGELQRQLVHRTKWRDSDTLCMAILLCIFELFAGTGSSDSWLQHARGIGVLIEQRGPAAHADGWDAAMLLSIRGILIMSDLFYPRDEACFLSRKEWHHVMKDRGRRLIHPPTISDESIEAVDEYNVQLAYVPEVVRLGYPALLAARSGMPADPVYIAAARPIAVRCHAHMKAWNEKYKHVFPPVEEVPSEDPDSLYATVIKYPVGWAGTMQISYWATMVLLQGMLGVLQHEHSYEKEQQEYVRGILRSVEHLGQGPLGAYRVGYSVRVAYEVASADAQAWIRRQLDRLSKTYAAVDKATYPEQRADAEGYS